MFTDVSSLGVFVWGVAKVGRKSFTKHEIKAEKGENICFLIFETTMTWKIVIVKLYSILKLIILTIDTRFHFHCVVLHPGAV